MGFLIKFLLFFVAAYLLMKRLVAFLTGKRNGQSAANRQTSQSQPKQPETQEDRIIEYQKKTFEKSEAEDVEFTEIKQPLGES
ncbi:hypothetical protein JS578_04030 [Dysgonomonadaceae bacterium zrk40]|nr:hypothetical protein JS578_04030 [Dysgonomonadaceae bacterium zrk40]